MTVTSADIDQLVAGQTVANQFLATVQRHGDRTALRWRNDDDSWGSCTWSEYAAQVAQVAAGLSAMGVGKGDRVVLMMRNIWQFHVADVAAYFLGATPVSIYNSSAADQVEYLVNHCEASYGIVEDAGFLAKFQAVRDQLTTLKGLAIVKDPDGSVGSEIVHWDTLYSHGSIDLDAAAAVAQPDDLATLIYTSGTTGPPKAVMISHHNIAWQVESLRQCITQHPEFQGELAGKKLVSYLPMAHIAERMVSHYQGVFLGYEVTTCPEPTLIAEYLREVHPNVVFGVPRVWEKIFGGVSAALAADPDRKAQFDDGVAAATAIESKIDWGTASEEEQGTWAFLQDVFATVRGLIGLDECELAITGAAPIPAELLAWFRAIGVPLAEVYGMSENTGAMTFTPVHVKPGTVGPALPGAEVVIADDGEVLCRGGLVFGGYLNDPEKTAEALDDEGWLHSGDIGVIDEDGYLKIVDRKKELIITAGGKNISPANLEAALKMIPLVGQACAIGDQRPFVSALVVLDPDVAPSWATAQGLDTTDLTELATHPEVVAAIEAGLEEVMAEFNNAERVKKVKILADEWLPDSELLTPTSKLKRRGIHATYSAEIEGLYT